MANIFFPSVPTYRPTVDPTIDDRHDTLFLDTEKALDFLTPDVRHNVDGWLSTSQDRAKDLRSLAVKGFLEDQFGEPNATPERVNVLRDAYAHHFLDVPAPVQLDDDRFFDMMREKRQFNADRKALRSGFIEAANTAALSMAPGEIEKQKQALFAGLPATPGFSADDLPEYYRVFNRITSAVQFETQPARSAARDIAKILQAFDATDFAATAGVEPAVARLMKLPKEQRGIALEFTRQLLGGGDMGLGKAGEKKPTTGLFSGIGQSIERGVDDVARELQFSGERMVEGMGARNDSEWRDAENQIEALRAGKLAPIKAGNAVTQGLFGAAESLPAMGLIAAGPVGAAMSVGYYQQGSYEKFKADPAMKDVPEWKVSSMALLSGVAQAALDKLQVGILKKLPGASAVVSNLQKMAFPGKYVAGTAAKLAGGLAAETGIEVLQDHYADAVAQQVGSWVSTDIDQPEWAKVNNKALRSIPELTLTMLPLVAVGAAGGTVRDMASARGLASSPELLRVAGFGPSQALAISSADNPVQALRAMWAERDPMAGAPAGASPAAVAAQAWTELRDKAEALKTEALDTADSGVRSLQRTADGWIVNGEDGSRHKLETPEAVSAMIQTMRRAHSQEVADAIRQQIDTFAEQDIAAGANPVWTMGKSDNGRAVLNEDGSATAFDPQGNVIPFDSGTLRNLGEEMRALGLNDAVIRGMNYAIRDDAGKLNRHYSVGEAGGIETVIHERFETLYKSGSLPYGQIWEAANTLSVLPQFDPAKVRNPGEKRVAESLRKMAMEDPMSDAEKRETFIELAVADVIGRMKDGTNIVPGSVQEAVRSAALQASPKQRGALNTLKGMLRAVRRYLETLFGLARRINQARRKGKLTESDAWTKAVDKLLGIDQQAEHNQAVAEQAGASFSLVDMTEINEVHSVSEILYRGENQGNGAVADSEPGGIHFSTTQEYARQYGDKIRTAVVRLERALDFRALGKSFTGEELAAFLDRNGVNLDGEFQSWSGGGTVREFLDENASEDFHGDVQGLTDPAGHLIKEAGFDGFIFAEHGSMKEPSVVVFSERSISAGAQTGAQDATFSLSDIRSDLDSLQESWKSQGISSFASVGKSGITLSSIKVPVEKQSQGIGSQKIRELQGLATRYGMRIVLSPSTDFGGSSKERLVKFYKALGFVENKGRSRDLSVSEEMIWTPEGATFSLGSVNTLETMAKRLDALTTDPKERLIAYSAAAESLRGMARAVRFNEGDTTEVEGLRMAQEYEMAAAIEDGWSKARRDELEQRQKREMLIAEARSDKKAMKRALVALDTVLMKLPPEIRGRVGGFVQLAQLTTDDARSKFLVERIEMMDKLMERFLKEEYRDRIEKIFDRSEPAGGKGEKAGGKLGTVGHAWFALARQASEMKAGEAADKVTLIDAKMASQITEEDIQALNDIWGPGTVTDDAGAVIFYQEWQKILETFGGMKDMDAVNLAAAWQAAEDTYVLNRHEWLHVLMERKERLAGIRETAVNEAGGPHDAPKANRLGITESLSGFGDLQLSFEQTAARAFGTGSVHQFVISNARKASDAEFIRMNQKRRAFGEFFRAAFKGGGHKKRAKLMELQERRDTGFSGVHSHLSELQAVHVLMLARDESSAEWLAGHGWNEAVIEDLKGWISPEAKAVMQWLIGQYDGQYHELNRVYSRMKGVQLPRVMNYAPRMVENAGKQDEMALDPKSAEGMTTGFLRRRWDKPQGPPKLADALQAYWGSQAVVSHWLAWAETLRDFRGTIASRDVRLSVATHHGRLLSSKLMRWVNHIETNGVREAISASEVGSILRRLFDARSKTALFGRLTVLAAQVPAAVASAAKVPVGAWMRSVARVDSGRAALSWSEMWTSPLIQARVDVEGGLWKAAASAEKNAPGILLKLFGDFGRTTAGALDIGTEKIGGAIGWTDAAMTTHSALVAWDAAYSQAVESGMPEDEAKRMAWESASIVVGQTAQPMQLIDKSLFEVEWPTTSRLIFAFQGANRQAWSLMYQAARNVVKDPKEFGKIMALYSVVIPTMVYVAKGLVRYLTSDDDWKDEWSLKQWGQQMAVAPLQGLVVVGPAMEAFFTAEPQRSDEPVVSALMQARSAFKKLFEDEQDRMKRPKDQRDFTLKDAGKIIGAVSQVLGGRTSSIGVANNLVQEFMGGVAAVREGDQGRESARAKKNAQDAKTSAKEAARKP